MLLSKVVNRVPTPRESAIILNPRIKVRFQERSAQVDLNASIAAYTGESNNDVILGSKEKWTVTNRAGKRSTFEFPLALASRTGRVKLAQGYFHFAPRHYFVNRRPTHLIDEWAAPALEQVARYCRGIRYYGASQFTNPSTCPASFQIDQEGDRRTLIRPHGHTAILYDMYSAEKAGSEDYKKFAELVGPRGLKLVDRIRFRAVPTSSTEYSVRVGGKIEGRTLHKLLLVPQFTIGKQKLSPNQLSEGTFKTLALLFRITTEQGSALLIEEPEVCVHQGLLSSILELIKSASQRKQIILSTHSDLVLDKVRPENVYRVTFERPTGTVVNHISKTMTAKEFSALREYLQTEGNLGEYWREGGLGDRP